MQARRGSAVGRRAATKYFKFSFVRLEDYNLLADLPLISSPIADWTQDGQVRLSQLRSTLSPSTKWRLVFSQIVPLAQCCSYLCYPEYVVRRTDVTAITSALICVYCVANPTWQMMRACVFAPLYTLYSPALSRNHEHVCSGQPSC